MIFNIVISHIYINIIYIKGGKGKDKPSHTPSKQKPFVKPTVDEVRAYCEERKNGINPQRFINYYEANGWVQGKGKPIKDWKAAVRNWEENEFNSDKQKSTSNIDKYKEFINDF